MVLVFCRFCYCALHLYEVSQYLNRFFRYRADTCVWWKWPILNIQKAITLKVGKTIVTVLGSACHLMMFNIFVKFHENMSSGFKVMERTQKLLSDKHNQKRKLYTPLHCILRMTGV